MATRSNNRTNIMNRRLIVTTAAPLRDDNWNNNSIIPKNCYQQPKIVRLFALLLVLFAVVPNEGTKRFLFISSYVIVAPLPRSTRKQQQQVPSRRRNNPLFRSFVLRVRLYGAMKSNDDNSINSDSNTMFMMTATTTTTNIADKNEENNNNITTTSNSTKDDDDNIIDDTLSINTYNTGNNNNELLDAMTNAAKRVGNDFFVFLRMNAAQALTKSLPDVQRQELLNRVITPSTGSSSNSSTAPTESKENDDNGGDDTDTRSVGEKITSYRIDKLQPGTNEDNKNNIMKHAQNAVFARVRNELEIQKERLALEAQRKLEEELEEQKMELELLQKYRSSNNTMHPILGKCVLDVGYKRLYSVSAETLSTIPVWQKQRIYRHNRAKQMSQDKLKTPHLGIPGIILLHEDILTGKLCILDGQHRVGMMQVLSSLQQQQNTTTAATKTIKKSSTKVTTAVAGQQVKMNSIDLNNIIVEVYPQTLSVAQDLFLEVNKAEPVKLIDLPGVIKNKERKIITDAVSKLESQYPSMFKVSQRCYQPHVNVDNLRDNLFASNVLGRNPTTIKTTKQLYDWMIQQNTLLKETKYGKNVVSTLSVSEKALDKARKYDFYLGLESNWLYY